MQCMKLEEPIMSGIKLQAHTRVHACLLKGGFMSPTDAFLPKMKMQIGPLSSACMLIGGSMLDISIVGDSLLEGRMSPVFGNVLRYLYVPVMCALALIYLFLTGNTDPGYVGLKSLSVNARAERRGVSLEDEDEEAAMVDESGPQQKELRGKRDYFQELRHSYYDYCDRCKVNLPMDRSIGHCDICDACIDGLDHHCPWVVRTQLLCVCCV